MAIPSQLPFLNHHEEVFTRADLVSDGVADCSFVMW